MSLKDILNYPIKRIKEKPIRILGWIAIPAAIIFTSFIAYKTIQPAVQYVIDTNRNDKALKNRPLVKCPYINSTAELHNQYKFEIANSGLNGRSRLLDGFIHTAKEESKKAKLPYQPWRWVDDNGHLHTGTEFKDGIILVDLNEDGKAGEYDATPVESETPRKY